MVVLVLITRWQHTPMDLLVLDLASLLHLLPLLGSQVQAYNEAR